jgi:hypothetical protein
LEPLHGDKCSAGYVFPKNEKRVCIELLTLWNNLQSGNFGISLRLRTTLNTG